MFNCTCLLLTAAACLAGANLHAADDSFVGKWKIDFDRSTVTGFQEKIEDLGNGEYKFSFGSDTETYFIDGKEHPTRYGDLRTMTAEGPDHWKEVTKRDGKVTNTGTWVISDGGKMLTITSDGTRPDGSEHKDKFEVKRIAGSSGLAGTWESTKVDPSGFPGFAIEPSEGDGLAFVTPAYKEHDVVKFDGKDYPNEGPRVSPGATTSGKRLDAHTLELTDKLKGKVIDTQRVELSADGKTLTTTFTYPGVEKKQVFVYTRE